MKKPVVVDIYDNEKHKLIFGPNYHTYFNKKTGNTLTWGETYEEDPPYCPAGPLILDIEVSTICSQGCKACYKNNTTDGKNMSLETFQKILSKLPKTTTQIAFGIGSLSANPELPDILKATRAADIVPNITINGSGMNQELYEMLAMNCGAVAVSRYNSDVCYNTVQKLNKWKKEEGATLQQVNIHQILSEETLPACFKLLEDMKTDERLNELNAAVFLLLKPKGDRNTLHPLKDGKAYKELVSQALDNRLHIGFDSCGCSSFLRAVKDRPEYKQLLQYAEPCESTAFSAYSDVNGDFYPCSFSVGEKGWENGISIVDCKNFLKDIWFHPRTIEFRENLINTVRCENNCISCPLFDLDIR